MDAAPAPAEPTAPLAPEPSPAPRRRDTRTLIGGALASLLVVGGIGGFFYWSYESQFVYTDKAGVEAPLIQLAPHTPGALKRVLVEEGDPLPAFKAVARVGDEMLTTQVSGVAVTVKKDIGSIYAPGAPVVTMIQPEELHVVARIPEDKGLKDVHEGQRALFTVDAFGSRTFEGQVESVSQINRSGDVVFSISDARQEQEFNVRIAYDVHAYPELRNGMSARVWIVK